MIQFYKGLLSSYNPTTHGEGIYFVTDKPFIYAQGVKYGIDKAVEDVEYDVNEHRLKVTYKGDSSTYVVLPLATDVSAGLMSSADKTKLDTMLLSWFEPIEEHGTDARLAWKSDLAEYTKSADISTAIENATAALKSGNAAIVVDGSIALKLSGETGNSLEIKSDGLFVSAPEEVPYTGENAIDVSAHKVTLKIDSTDNILTQTTAGLKSDVTMTYDSSARKIYLLGKASEASTAIEGKVKLAEIDASAFVKDGILYGSTMVKADAEGKAHAVVKDISTDLTDLTPNHQHLVLCFSTFDGEDFKFDWHAIDVEALIDVYKGGTGIAIDASNNISVKIAADTSANKNFLDVEYGSLAVRNIDADCTKTVSDVKVLGGPLSGQVNNWPTAWKDASGNNIVPANLSMQDFITGLYFQELKGTVSKGDYVWNPTVAQPNVSLSSTATQEVGTQLTATFSTNATINNNTRTVTVSQDDHNFGMFVGDTYQTGNKTFSKNGEPSGDIHIDAATWNGNNVESSGDSVTVVEGTNTLYVKQTGLHAIVDAFRDEPICYGATNQKSKNTDSSVDINESDFFHDKSLSSNKSVSVTAYYPIYVNGVGSALAYDENTPCPVPEDVPMVADIGTKLALVGDNRLFTVNFPTMVDGGEGWSIAIQKDKSITYAKSRNGLTGKCTDDIKDEFIRSVRTITKMSGGVATEYYVWSHTGTKGYNYVSLKID